MALTLTQTARLTKRTLVGLTILGFLLLITFISYQIYYYKYYLPHKPPVEEKPTLLFGLLPPVNFPQSSVSSSNYSYSLATTTGGLPTDLPKLVKVYFIPQLGTTLLAPEKAQSLATSLLFPNGPDNTSTTQYHFSDSSGGQLTLDLNSGNFKFQRTASPSAEASSATRVNALLPDPTKIISDFKNYLSNKGLLKEDLKNGRSKVIYDNSSQADSQIATVSIWPSDLDKLQIVTPDPNIGLIKAVVTKFQDEALKYASLNFTYWGEDTKTFSTYPIKSANQAFTDLKNGQGVVVIEPKLPQVSLTSVRLAYYQSEQYSPYLEPIYVFEGENFMAYVSAITPEYLSK